MLFDEFLGLTTILVIHHTGVYSSFLLNLSNEYPDSLSTDCGASHFKDEDIRKAHLNRLPDHPEIKSMVFGAFDE